MKMSAGMSAPSTPHISHHIIPIADRTPVLLLGFDVTPPEPVEIALVIDQSDSCGDLSKLFSYTQKLLAQLPSDWSLTLFRLSSTEIISRPGLKLRQLCESSDWSRELCVDRGVHQTGARRGSFLRPVLERLKTLESNDRRLLLVLTDGKFGDFGRVEIPAGTDVIAILPGSVPDELGSRKPIEKQIKILSMQDPEMDHIFAGFTHPFFGPVVVQPKSDSQDTDRFYRVDSDGRLTAWSRIPHHILNLAGVQQFVLFDGTLDEFQPMQWELKSCASGSRTILSGSQIARRPQRSFEKKIVDSFTRGISGTQSDAICWMKRGESHFVSLDQQFRIATTLADQAESWVDNDGKTRVFSNLANLSLVSEDGRCRHHAILVIAVVSPETKETLQVGLFSLHRDQNPAWQIQPESSLNDMTTNDTLSIRFDSSRYRWFLSTKSARVDGQEILTELSYYESEPIQHAIAHPDGDVIVLFSGQLG